MRNSKAKIPEEDLKKYCSGFDCDGHPWTRSDGSLHQEIFMDTALASDMDPEKHEIAVDWIRRNLIPVKTPYRDHSGYGIKHRLQKDEKIYTTNNQFKDLMLECGFKPVNEHDLNWIYCLSRKSPGLQYYTHPLKKSVQSKKSKNDR